MPLAHGQKDDSCGANATEIRRTENSARSEIECQCNQGFEAIGEKCVPIPKVEQHAVVNLASNPRLAEIDLIELRLVEARMARLHKALDILQGRDQDASKEWKELHAEMVQQSHEIDWQAFLFATAGLGEVLKLASVIHLQEAEAVQNETVWAELGVEKANLQKMLSSSHGHDAEVLKEAIEACDQVERVHQTKDSVERGKQLWEVMVIEKETRQPTSPDRRTTDALYSFSAFMGRTAMVFGKGIVEKSNTLASFSEPFAEANGVFLMMLQEERQMDELSNHTGDRQTKRRQIHEQLGTLEQRQQTLRWAIQRADPSVRLDVK